MKAAVPLGVVLLCAGGCANFFRGRSLEPRPVAQATPGPISTGPLAITALPVYRLVTSPVLADAPSRLLVIQVRLSSSEGRALSLAPDDLALVLPNGERGRVFDRGRAMELLRRTTLAEADLSYLQASDYAPGGLQDVLRPQLTEMVMSNLLGAGAFASEQVVEGYVVVDTGAPLTSLGGASIEAVAYGLSDAVPVRGAYQFATAPAAAEAH